MALREDKERLVVAGDDAKTRKEEESGDSAAVPRAGSGRGPGGPRTLASRLAVPLPERQAAEPRENQTPLKLILSRSKPGAGRNKNSSNLSHARARTHVVSAIISIIVS